MPTIRAVNAAETPELVAVATGLFTEEDAELLLRATLDDLHAGRLGDGHHAHAWTDDLGRPAGWVYYSENPKANGVWDLWWIGVAPGHQGRGVGKDLLQFVEDRVRDGGGRLLIIETSAPHLRTRRLRESVSLCGRRVAARHDDATLAVRAALPRPTAAGMTRQPPPRPFVPR